MKHTYIEPTKINTYTYTEIKRNAIQKRKRLRHIIPDAEAVEKNDKELIQQLHKLTIDRVAIGIK